MLHWSPWRAHCLPVNVLGALINRETTDGVFWLKCCISLPLLFLSLVGQKPTVVRFGSESLTWRCSHFRFHFPIHKKKSHSALNKCEEVKVVQIYKKNLHWINFFAVFTSPICVHGLLCSRIKTLSCGCGMLALCWTGRFRGHDPWARLTPCVALWPLHFNSDVTAPALPHLLNLL